MKEQVIHREKIYAGAVAASVIALFHFLGNSVDVGDAHRSLFTWLHIRWQSYDGGSTYSHSYLIPFVSLYAVWRLREKLREVAGARDYTGLAFLLMAFALHWLGLRCYLPRLSVLSFILMCWAIPYFIYGRQVARWLIFPCAYLLLCVPMTFLDSLAWRLRYLMSILSTAVMNGIGMESFRSGTAIYTDVAGGFSFDIADPCSGLRSFLALISLTGAYAYFYQKGLAKQWILFAMAAPIAVLSNMVRIISIALVAAAGGVDLALKWHDISGFFVFAVAILLMMGIKDLLDLDFKQLSEKWKKENKRT